MENAKKQKKTHGQIVAALKAEAKEREKNTNDVYNQFFREVFLYELMQHHRGWVLKGGTSIYCRIPGARQTKDLDLYRQDDPTSSGEAAEDLVSTMNGHRFGPYKFEVRRSSGGTPTGTINSERLTITVIYGISNRLVAFGVDVSGDLAVTGAVEPLTVAATFKVSTEFLPPRFEIYSYPVASQIADKVCAMYERHGATPPGRASTRYHDLYDVALIAQELTVTAVELRAALETQSRIRRITLPDSLIIPDSSWVAEYPEKAKHFGGERHGLETLDEAMRIAGLLINPILGGKLDADDCSWNIQTLRWS